MSAASRPSGGPGGADADGSRGLPAPTAAAAPAGHDDAWQLDAARGIVARYRRLFWLVAAPVFVLLALLAVWQAHQARLALVADLQRRATQHQAALQALARAADEHVKDLRRVVEQELISVPRTPDPAIRDALQQRLADGRPDGLTLDGLSPLLQLDSAQLLWTDLAQRPDDGVFGRLQALSQTAALAHQRHGDFTWSFHFGWPERHVMVFPWAPTSEFIEALGQKNLQRAVADWFGYEVFTGGTPEHNPLRRAFWTEAYVDAGGRGLMVSHMSPVYSADAFRGVVGADVRLETIATTLRRLTGAETHWWVVSDRGEVLAESHPGVAPGATAAASAASSAASAAPLTAVPRLEARLPEGLDLARLKRLAATDRAHPVGDWRLVVQPMQEAPWTLVVGETERSLDARVLPTLLPFALIASGLLAMFIGGQWLVRRRLLDPALAVMAYLAARSRDGAAAEPQVGRRWQPWAAMISRIFREQDESRRAERRSEAFKSAIVDNALAAIITTDDDGAIVEFNPAAERLFGQQRAQVLGLQVGEVIVPHRLRAAHVAGMKRMREGGTPRVMGRRLEMSALRADGQEIPIEMVLWRTAVEGVAHYTASIADLSERREQARQIERQRDALRQSEKLTAMGSLLAGVAHELNNPLAIVLGRASLLEEKCADRPDLLGDAQRIRDAAERCGRIVRTFLNMARSRPATRSAVSLNDLAQAAADMLGYTYRSHGIELRLGLDAALPAVQADGDQIGQVVLNLLVNAQQVLAGCDAPREVALRTGLADGAADGGPTVWLRVVDNGPGVPADLREKIFEPFFTTKPEGIGTGLGLAVSRSLAREHGGELRLEDGAPGAGGMRPGASFLLSLPLAGAAEVPATPMPAVNPPAALDVDDEARATRVLVVDDESELTDLMRTMLEDAGHEVVTAESGEVALELLAMVAVDVIVSDLRMPDMDGSALWRAVRERHPTLATRMLFVTGDTLSPAARQFLDEARCARLDKPFTREALVAGVAERLAQQ